jgi:hypothetical protein
MHRTVSQDLSGAALGADPCAQRIQSLTIEKFQYLLKCVTLPTPEERAWCDRVADYFALNGGLPPITGRTMAWLMICDPAEQTPADISAATGASRASLTASLRLLTSSGLVRRISRAGSRAAYYRIVDEAWSQALRQRFASLASFVALIEAGQELVGADPARAKRLGAADQVYRWFAESIGPLWDRWESRQSARAADEGEL